MRICMMNDNLYRSSGITVAIQRLIETPAFAQIDVYLAGCETRSGQKSSDEKIDIVAVDHYRCFPLMQANPALLGTLYQFAKWAQRMRFDVIHVHHRRLAVLADMLGHFTGVPVLFTGHLTFPQASWFKIFSPRIATGVSPAVVNYLRRSTRAKDIRLIHNPVPFPNQNFDPPQIQGFRAVSVGRLDSVKDHKTLIEAWAGLRETGVEAHLDIFGEGPLRAELESRIAELRLQDCIQLRGFVPDVFGRLPNYNFNVLTSWKEGFPNVVVEAAAHHLPSLVTDVDGSRDTLPPALELPNRLPPGDVRALSNALEHWWKAPLLVRRDGQRFRTFLRERCSPDIVGEQFRALYLELIASRGRDAYRGRSSSSLVC